jgi:hypothetical protein
MAWLAASDDTKDRLRRAGEVARTVAQYALVPLVIYLGTCPRAAPIARPGARSLTRLCPSGMTSADPQPSLLRCGPPFYDAHTHTKRADD